MSFSRRCQSKNEVTIPRILEERMVMSSGEETIDLSTAENWLMRPELMQELSRPNVLASLLAEKDLSYSQGIGGPEPTRLALSSLLNTTFSPATPVHPSHLVLTPGGSVALDALVQQICDPGDAILLATPYWSGLDLSLSVQNEAVVVPVDIALDEFDDAAATVRGYEEALRSARAPVRAVLVCNPTNPVGQCYTREVLQAILEFCAANGMHFVSDEVYALSVHNADVEFCSALALEGPVGNVHVVYSLSKDFGCSGIRLGALITQHQTAVRMGAALTTHNQVSCFTSLLAAGCLLAPERLPEFIAVNAVRLRESCKVVADFFALHKIPFFAPDAGIYISARLSQDDSEAEEMHLLQQMKKQRVCLVPGRACHFAEAGWFRIVFAFPEPVVVEGLQRIALAIETVCRERQEST